LLGKILEGRVGGDKFTKLVHMIFLTLGQY
jgi:hypothetical protein